MSFLITSLHPSFGLPICRCPPTSISQVLITTTSFSNRYMRDWYGISKNISWVTIMHYIKLWKRHFWSVKMTLILSKSVGQVMVVSAASCVNNRFKLCFECIYVYVPLWISPLYKLSKVASTLHIMLVCVSQFNLIHDHPAIGTTWILTRLHVSIVVMQCGLAYLQQCVSDNTGLSMILSGANVVISGK